MNKPSYEELASLVIRIYKSDCNNAHPDNCKECHLFFSGLCKELEDLSKRLLGQG